MIRLIGCAGVILILIIIFTVDWNAIPKAPVVDQPQRAQQTVGNRNDQSSPARSDLAEKAKSWKLLKGITQADLFKLEPFRGTQVTTTEGPNGDSWRCTYRLSETEISIDAMGLAPDKVRMISVIARHPGQPEATAETKRILGELATVPFDGADPEAAKQWVERNLNQTAETVINGVRFMLTNTGEAHELIIEGE